MAHAAFLQEVLGSLYPSLFCLILAYTIRIASSSIPSLMPHMRLTVYTCGPMIAAFVYPLLHVLLLSPFYAYVTNAVFTVSPTSLQYKMFPWYPDTRFIKEFNLPVLYIVRMDFFFYRLYEGYFESHKDRSMHGQAQVKLLWTCYFSRLYSVLCVVYLFLFIMHQLLLTFLPPPSQLVTLICLVDSELAT